MIGGWVWGYRRGWEEGGWRGRSHRCTALLCWVSLTCAVSQNYFRMVGTAVLVYLPVQSYKRCALTCCISLSRASTCPLDLQTAGLPSQLVHVAHHRVMCQQHVCVYCYLLVKSSPRLRSVVFAEQCYRPALTRLQTPQGHFLCHALKMQKSHKRIHIKNAQTHFSRSLLKQDECNVKVC